jgi:L-threonylcarbamoyladenylate synthase
MSLDICLDSPIPTLHFAGDPAHPEPQVIALAAHAIRQGKLVAFPTETVYGLGADALNPRAVQGIFRAKGRPADNPLIVHIAGADALEDIVATVPALTHTLAAHFWPGPLTLVLPASPRVPAITTGGLNTVAVRVPAHPVALALLQAAGCPIAAPSANRSGRPSPTSAAHVLEDLRDKSAIVLDGGACAVGVESTVLDLTEMPPVLLRPGGVPIESIEAVIGVVARPSASAESARRSPGARYRHYAPQTTLRVVTPADLPALLDRLLAEGKTVSVLARRPVTAPYPHLSVRVVPGDLGQYARELFAALRALDVPECQLILAEAVAEEGLGRAIMERLRRASSGSGSLEQHDTEGSSDG